MKYVKLFENFDDGLEEFNKNIEDNLELLLVDLTDNGYGYNIDISNDKSFSVEIYKGNIPLTEREIDDSKDEFLIDDVSEEILYLVEYMLDKLGPEYICEYILETRWDQFTVNSIVDGEYDEVFDEVDYLDIISITVRFFVKPT
jgi:hypothetical protein